MVKIYTFAVTKTKSFSREGRRLFLFSEKKKFKNYCLTNLNQLYEQMGTQHIMEKQTAPIRIHVFILFISLASLLSCERFTPGELQFSKYPLRLRSVDPKYEIQPNEIVIVNNQKELEDHFPLLADPDPRFPPINFSKNTLLMVGGGILYNYDYEEIGISLFQQGKNEYSLNISIPIISGSLGNQNSWPPSWSIAILTPKIAHHANFQLNRVFDFSGYAGETDTITVLYAGVLFDVEDSDLMEVDITNIDFSVIENLDEQPLPVILHCIEGKWRLSETRSSGFAGPSQHYNTYFEFDPNHIIVTYEGETPPLSRTFPYTWKKATTFVGRDIFVMWCPELLYSGWCFDSIIMNQLTARLADHELFSISSPTFFYHYIFLSDQ